MFFENVDVGTIKSMLNSLYDCRCNMMLEFEFGLLELRQSAFQLFVNGAFDSFDVVGQ